MGKAVFPGYRFGPDGQSAIFNSAEEVPPGWGTHPAHYVKQDGVMPTPATEPAPVAVAAPEPAPLPEPPPGLARDLLRSRLNALGVKFAINASRAKLYDLLQAAEANGAVSKVPSEVKPALTLTRDQVITQLTTHGVVFDPAATTEHLYDALMRHMVENVA